MRNFSKAVEIVLCLDGTGGYMGYTSVKTHLNVSLK